MEINKIDINYIKSLGKNKTEENLSLLFNLYNNELINLDLKREVVSSIGRQNDKAKIASFIKENYKSTKNSMDMVYQFYRTCLYNLDLIEFKQLAKEIEDFYQNEMIFKMKEFYLFKKKNKTEYLKPLPSDKLSIINPTLLIGDCESTLSRIKNNIVNLVFTSPPYYNAKDYSQYKSYSDYLNKMKNVFLKVRNVLEDGRFLIVNVSPVITKRTGREFESIRYPIHFDFHKILNEIGFEFIDEIIWIKPEYSVPNRNGSYFQNQIPLTYKPNCVTESILVYRKKAPFLLDENIKPYKQKNFKPELRDDYDRTNCWVIPPVSSKEHPAVFPKELCRRIIHYYSFSQDLVLDPFAGSGTFGEIAIEMDRIPILCEMKNEYVERLLDKGFKPL